MPEKVTKMVLKVDLQCSCCYKKIKKILANFCEIKSSIYDEKQNTVTITVESSDPEKIRCKLLCKGGKTIKGIEIIKEPPKPPKDGKDKDGKPKDTGKSAGGNTEVTTIICGPTIGYPTSCPVPVCSGPRCDCKPGAPCSHGCGRPAHGCPPVKPVQDCCGSCSECNRGGSCNRGCGKPPPCCVKPPPPPPPPPCCVKPPPPPPPCCVKPPPCYDGCGRPGCGKPAPCYDGCGSGSGHGGCTPM
ncbi:hypothetical protein Vadar_034006 [Vaccinium darrowii]|uniref:Uncharacterized protein n=1 Tax=Vaccinium darrowii TaxID=229202 RepID=A0ACB7XE88_9ERIC|nr:hypothetical protein Vadar_034006 [Vaccinium darrowii]